MTNQMRACGETLKDQAIVEKILRFLSPRFDYVVAAIEELKEIPKKKVDELQCPLEAHE